MNALLSISLFWSLLSPVALLNCLLCTGNDCDSPRKQKCSVHENACISSVAALDSTLLEDIRVGNFKVETRNCVPVAACLLSYLSISAGHNARFRIKSECCYSNMCNKNPPSPMPHEVTNHKHNGVQCPTCFAFDANDCPQNETIECTGGETKCVEAAGRFSLDELELDVDIYARGCGTPNSCIIPLPNANLAPNKVRFMVTQLQCTDAS